MTHACDAGKGEDLLEGDGDRPLMQPITMTITCRTSPDHSTPGVRHSITLEVDGTLTTPHDLAAERLAVALGGYLTCIELVDKVAPAFREWARLQRREGPLPILSRNEGRTWSARQRGSCCPTGGVRDPVEAAEHARSPWHLARLHGIGTTPLQRLVQSAEVPQPSRAIGTQWTLWRCGVASQTVAAIDADLGLQEPMDPAFYLAVLCRGPNRVWLRRMIALSGVTQHSAAWLAWTYGATDRRDPHWRVEWLRLGIPVRAIVALGEAYRPSQVQAVSQRWRITPAAAALHMMAWQERGLALSVEQWCRPGMLDLGYPPRPPSLSSVERVLAAVGDERAERISAALAIAEHGSVAAASAVLRAAAKGIPPGAAAHR
jgi:hypothetical protein